MATFDPTASNAPRTGSGPRTRGTIGRPQDPSVRRQVIPIATPEVAPEGEGFDLGGAFRAFFGDVRRAAESLSDAYQAREAAEIERENREQEARAFADVQAGVERRPELAADRDYADAYTVALARREAGSLATEFKTQLLTAEPGQDPQALTEAFLDEQLAGLEDGGDALFSAELLGAFAKLTSPALAAYTKGSARAQLQTGLDRQAQSVRASFDELDVTDIPDIVEQNRALDPLHPEAAAPRAIAQLIAGAGDNKSRLMRLNNMLTSAGSGVDGKSYADSFPEAWLEHSGKIATQFYNGKNLSVMEAVRAIEVQAANTTDPRVLMALVGRLEDLREANGSPVNAIDATIDSIGRSIDTAADDIAEFNAVAGVFDGTRTGAPVSQKAIKNQQPRLLAEIGGTQNPLAAPQAAATVVLRTNGVISEEWQTAMSDALMDPTNPEATSAAFAFYQGLEQRGKEYAVSRMDSEAKLTYEFLRREVGLKGQPIDVTLQRWNQVRARAPEVDKTEFRQLYSNNTTEIDAKRKIDRGIVDALEDRFGTRLADDGLVRTIRDMVKSQHINTYGTPGIEGGSSKVDTVIEQVVGSLDNLEPVTRPGGRIALEQVRMPNILPIYNEFGQATGETTTRVPLGDSVTHPDTGEPVSTLDIWTDDARRIAASLSGTGLNPSTMWLSSRSRWSPGGFYVVQREDDALGDVPLTIDLGETITVGGQTITLPPDMDMAISMLQELDLNWDGITDIAPGEALGEGVQQEDTGMVSFGVNTRVRLVPYGTTGFMMLYRPGFTERLPQ